MKKLLLFVAVITAASFASCKKDYTCTCVTTTNGVAGSADVTTLKGVSKASARANCMDKTTTNAGVTSTTDCSLN